MDELEARVRACICQHQMLQKGDTVIVALSGGADSMALFHFLFSHADALGIRVRAAHVDHGLRGAEAKADAAFVRRECAARGVPLDEISLSPPPRAGEAWGRRERYAFFARLAQAHGALVATAHTASDNAETVLLNLARGSAVRGAAGIPPVRRPYIRPFLTLWREDILRYLAASGVPYVTDATNGTDQYARNRVRHEVLPMLERVHPGAARSLVRFAAEMAGVAEYIDGAAQALLARARCGARPACAAAPRPPAMYDAAVLCAAPQAVRRAALASLIAGAAQQQKTSLVPEAEAILCRGAGAVQLGRGVFLRASRGRLFVERGPAPKKGERPADACRPFDAWQQPLAPGVFKAPGGAVLEVRTEKYEKMVNSEKDTRKVLKFYADYDRIQGNPYFRTRRPGDRFRPAGRGVTKTLKKLLSEERVPQAARGALAVLAEGEALLWVAGFGFAEGLAPSEGTKTVVTILVRQMEETK